MFINLTPHEIVMKVNDVDGLIKVPPSGEVLRLDEDVPEMVDSRKGSCGNKNLQD